MKESPVTVAQELARFEAASSDSPRWPANMTETNGNASKASQMDIASTPSPSLLIVLEKPPPRDSIASPSRQGIR
ncbi:hypothetical protein L2E82_37546 [Cichorium intybus]|uniref:Uncharacterized protein n=1 Tax=Cichorium intybus TaxID=13427 RepID=A0ACB9AG78_CICIN|nr:hypothetical protein L2E82_37546 [Cichorium intybus]